MTLEASPHSSTLSHARGLRIAVVGTGISGMLAARILDSRHEVHVFEAADSLGGHTATVDVETASGRYAVDTGFIVFNDWTYPGFIELTRRLGVEARDTVMSFSVKSARSGLEYNGTDLPGLFAQKRNLFRPEFHRMIRDILRFNRQATRDHERGTLPEGSLEDYLRAGGYSSAFAQDYIVPMGAAIWSANERQIRDYPVRAFVAFFKNHGMLSVDDRPIWKTIRGGSRSYISPLLAPILARGNRIHTASPVEGVHRHPTHVQLQIGGRHPRTESFDHVVLAAHADQTMKMLRAPSALEREIIGAFGYQPNDVILHTDTSVLPNARRAWAAWNYWVPPAMRERVAVTYDMNRLQGLRAPETFLVSLNLDVRPEHVIRRFVYDHPVFDQAAVQAQPRWGEISSEATRTFFAGAYWGNGFHEDGVQSALRVTREFGLGLEAI